MTNWLTELFIIRREYQHNLSPREAEYSDSFIEPVLAALKLL